jgi:hypothetical protein
LSHSSVGIADSCRPPETSEDAVGLVEDAKTFLSEEKHRIALHDLVATETRKIVPLLMVGQFPVQATSYSNEEFLSRVARYEDAVAVNRRGFSGGSNP